MSRKKQRLINAVKRHLEKKRSTKYRVTTVKRHKPGLRYEDIYKVKDLSTGKTYTVRHTYGQLGRPAWYVN